MGNCRLRAKQIPACSVWSYRNKSTDCYGNRLECIFDSLKSIIDQYKPSEAGMETLYFAKNVSSAMAVAEARGVITLCLSKNCILLGEYTPLVIKQSITGHAKAEKSLVQEYLKILLGLIDDINQIMHRTQLELQ